MKMTNHLGLTPEQQINPKDFESKAKELASRTKNVKDKVQKEQTPTPPWQNAPNMIYDGRLADTLKITDQLMAVLERISPTPKILEHAQDQRRKIAKLLTEIQQWNRGQ